MTQQTTNEDLLQTMQDLMQMTGDGFTNLQNRMDGIETRMSNIEQELKSINAILRDHDLRLAELKTIAQDLSNKHVAYINDIAEILDRVATLEKRAPHITKTELRELQDLLQEIVDWAIKAAKVVKVPLKLKS